MAITCESNEIFDLVSESEILTARYNDELEELCGILWSDWDSPNEKEEIFVVNLEERPYSPKRHIVTRETGASIICGYSSFGKYNRDIVIFRSKYDLYIWALDTIVPELGKSSSGIIAISDLITSKIQERVYEIGRKNSDSSTK